VNGTLEVVASVPDAFARVVAGALSSAGPAGSSLFLSGGPTARACYERLAEVAGAGGPVPWQRVDVFWGDERCVPVDHPDSNHRLAHEALLDRVGPVRSDHPMYEGGDPAAAAARYDVLIAGLASLDVVHLGMGPDGHTASLFAGSEALAVDDPGRLVVPSRDPEARNPHDRLTLTLPAIARSRLVVFTVSGAAKRAALARVRAGEDLPATRVRAGEVVWLVDDDAMGA
jgi:6-phosphogluconolactonase